MIAVVVGLVPAVPLIVDASGVPESAPGVAVLLAVSAGVTRILALPVVDAWLPAWAKKGPPREDG